MRHLYFYLIAIPLFTSAALIAYLLPGVLGWRAGVPIALVIGAISGAILRYAFGER